MQQPTSAHTHINTAASRKKLYSINPLKDTSLTCELHPSVTNTVSYISYDQCSVMNSMIVLTQEGHLTAVQYIFHTHIRYILVKSYKI